MASSSRSIRKQVIRTMIFSWPCDLLARLGLWIRSRQVEFIFSDAEAKSTPSIGCCRDLCWNLLARSPVG
jgi:hypothetical protein